MSDSIPIRLSAKHLAELERKFDARRPMLQHVASEVCSELRDLLEDKGINAHVTKTVLTSKQFRQLAQSNPARHPLVELTSQIDIRVLSSNLNDLESIRETIETHYQSVQAGWKEEGTQLTLKFVIPPQAKPDGYRNRDDVPNLMQLTIASSPSAPRMTTEGERIPNLALIMKGGGIKGLAYVGAMDLLRDHYEFNWYVGTSAGAITAILLAAGFDVEQLQRILEEKNFKDFFDAPLYKQPFNLVFRQGLHPGKEFTDWMDKLLAEKLGQRQRVTLGDIEEKTGNRLTIYASQQRKKAVTFDSSETSDIAAAYAARCSMSIPLVFIPESDQGILAFDGGLQNNFPIRQLLEDHGEVPFISMYLGAESFEPIKEQHVLLRVLDIWMTQGEDEYIELYQGQTVIVDPRPIGFLDFNLTDDEKKFLVVCGRVGALAHIDPESDELTKLRVERDDERNRLEAIRAKQNSRRKVHNCIIVILLVLIALLTYWFWPHQT